MKSEQIGIKYGQLLVFNWFMCIFKQILAKREYGFL